TLFRSFFVTGPYSLEIDIGPDVCETTACTSSLSDADDVATTWLYAPPRVSERPTFSTVPRSPSRRVRTGVGTVGRGWRNTTCPHSSVRSNAGQASAISWTASSRDSDHAMPAGQARSTSAGSNAADTPGGRSLRASDARVAPVAGCVGAVNSASFTRRNRPS